MDAHILTLFENSFDGLIPEDWGVWLSPRFLTYRPTHKIKLETKKYNMTTAETTSELIELFKLRYECFLRDVEQKEGVQLDLDEFDSICDHLVIRCNETNEIVGTYRMIPSTISKKFYSQGEFEISEFLKAEGIKVELGRACIHEAHRNGHVIDLLWKGIGEYCNITGAKYLFGCSSVYTTSPIVSRQLVEYFEENNEYSHDFAVRPTEKYNMNLDTVWSHPFEEATVKAVVPSLLRSYIKAGAKIYGHPALDKDFDCIDFLTIMDIDNLNSSYKRRYFK